MRHAVSKFRKFPEIYRSFITRDKVYKDITCTDQNFLSRCPDLFNVHMLIVSPLL